MHTTVSRKIFMQRTVCEFASLNFRVVIKDRGAELYKDNTLLSKNWIDTIFKEYVVASMS